MTASRFESRFEPCADAALRPQVYLAGAPGVNVAAQARCWSLPVGGAYYNGDGATGRQYLMTDGDLTTFSHSGDDNTNGKGHIDMCVFDQAMDVRRVTVWPRQVLVQRHAKSESIQHECVFVTACAPYKHKLCLPLPARD